MLIRIGQEYRNLQEAARSFAASWDTILFLACMCADVGEHIANSDFHCFSSAFFAKL